MLATVRCPAARQLPSAARVWAIGRRSSGCLIGRCAILRALRTSDGLRSQFIGPFASLQRASLSSTLHLCICCPFDEAAAARSSQHSARVCTAVFALTHHSTRSAEATPPCPPPHRFNLPRSPVRRGLRLGAAGRLRQPADGGAQRPGRGRDVGPDSRRCDHRSTSSACQAAGG